MFLFVWSNHGREKLDHRQFRSPGLKACLVCLQRKGHSAARSIPFQRMLKIRQLFSHKGLLVYASYLKDELWLCGRHQGTSGEQDLTQKQNYMSLRQLPKNTWLTKGKRMLRKGKAHVLFLACSLPLVEHHKKGFLSNPAGRQSAGRQIMSPDTGHLSSCLQSSSSARDPQIGSEQLEV